MKVIKYQLCTKINHGTEDNPDYEDRLKNVTLDWNETNEIIAQQEAYKSIYTIEDDGRPEPESSSESLEEAFKIFLGV